MNSTGPISPLLYSYINNTSGTSKPQTTKPALNASSPNVEKKSKKAKVAKAALGLALIGTVAICGISAFRNNNSIKAIKNSIKNRIHNAAVNKKSKGNVFSIQHSIENVTNSKDSITRHFLSKIPGYKKFDELTTNFYMKCVRSTMTKKYTKCAQKIQEADSQILEAARESGFKNLKRLEELLLKRREKVGYFASTKGIDKRIHCLDMSMSNLDEEAFQKLKGVLDSSKVKETIGDFTKESVVKNQLQYAKHIQKALMNEFTNLGLTAKESKELEKIISKLRTPENKNIIKRFERANKGFRKVFEIEKGDFFNKLRDIKCGSAPTDIMGIMGTTGLLGLYIAQADTKEERVSVSLNTGVPLLTTLGTTLAATNKLISGIKLFGLAGASGFISSRAAKAIDKKYKEKNKVPVPETIITLEQFAKEARNNIKTTVKPTFDLFKI